MPNPKDRPETLSVIPQSKRNGIASIWSEALQIGETPRPAKLLDNSDPLAEMQKPASALFGSPEPEFPETQFETPKVPSPQPTTHQSRHMRNLALKTVTVLSFLAFAIL